MIASQNEIAPNVNMVDDDFLPRPDFYAEGDYLKTDIPRGVTRNRLGTRICSLSQDFLLGMRKAIVDECGSAADEVFKSCGRRWGDLLARRFEKEMTEYHGKALKQFPLATFQACLIQMFSHHGWGVLRLDLDHYHRGLLLVELENPVFGSLVPTADQPVETLMAGILAGFFAYFSGEDLDCVQTACMARGAPFSRFIIGLRPRMAPVGAWLSNGKAHEAILGELLEVRV
jgi:predicted hydrocarbon binding protein